MKLPMKNSHVSRHATGITALHLDQEHTRVRFRQNFGNDYVRQRLIRKAARRSKSKLSIENKLLLHKAVA